MTFLTVIQSFFRPIEIALITILVGFIIAKLAGKIAKKVLAEAELNRILTAAGFRPISDAFGTILEYLIYTVTLLIVLQQFGLTKIVLGIIATLATLVVGFSLLLAIRDFIPNFIIGLFLRKRMKRFLGKKIRIGTITGRLEHFGFVASILKNKDEYYVPHLYASKQKITRLQAD